MTNVMAYNGLNGEIVFGTSPRDIIRQILPSTPAKEPSYSENIASEVMRQRAATNYDPNQVIYFSDVARRLRK